MDPSIGFKRWAQELSSCQGRAWPRPKEKLATWALQPVGGVQAAGRVLQLDPTKARGLQLGPEKASQGCGDGCLCAACSPWPFLTHVSPVEPPVRLPCCSILLPPPCACGLRYWAFSVNELGMCDVKAMVHAIHSIKKRELGGLQEVARAAEAAPRRDCAQAGQAQLHQKQPSPVPHPARGAMGSGDEWIGGQGLRERAQLSPPTSEASDEAQAGLGPGQVQGRQGGGEPGQVDGQQEVAGEGPSFEIQAVAHSLGGAALMVYIVTQCIRHRPHHLSHAILLSPAGAPPLPARLLRCCSGFLVSSRGHALLLGHPCELSRVCVSSGRLMSMV